jgi:oligoribonuclease
MRLLWLDMETTGLDPNHCLPLEIVVATADLHDPFNIEFVYDTPIWFAPHPYKAHERGWSETSVNIAERRWVDLNPLYANIHLENGLLHECERHGKPPHVVDQELVKTFPLEGDGDGQYVLAGSSVHFDHAFIRVHFPRLNERLGHRHYDVSALKLFCESMGMPTLEKAGVHRARADIIESVNHAKECAAWLSGRQLSR